MSEKTVMCAKLKQELPAIDPATPQGRQASMLALMIGGPAMQQRVQCEVSQPAWDQWVDHMRMVMNEYRIDPTSDESNEQLRPHMEAFFFGQAKQIDNYVPPK